jgi:hypothetical protein
MADISPSTGEEYYSGDWENIKDVLRVLNMDDGKLARVTQPMVNRFQETTDRDIDGILEDTYHLPIRAIEQIRPSDGVTLQVFPGDVRRCARYWAAGMLLLTEFQNLEQNMTDQAQAYVDDARRQIYAMKRFTHRIHGQEFKSQFSRTIPPNFQPPSIPEPDF